MGPIRPAAPATPAAANRSAAAAVTNTYVPEADETQVNLRPDVDVDMGNTGRGGDGADAARQPLMTGGLESSHGDRRTPTTPEIEPFNTDGSKADSDKIANHRHIAPPSTTPPADDPPIGSGTNFERGGGTAPSSIPARADLSIHDGGPLATPASALVVFRNGTAISIESDDDKDEYEEQDQEEEDIDLGPAQDIRGESGLRGGAAEGRSTSAAGPSNTGWHRSDKIPADVIYITDDDTDDDTDDLTDDLPSTAPSGGAPNLGGPPAKGKPGAAAHHAQASNMGRAWTPARPRVTRSVRTLSQRSNRPLQLPAPQPAGGSLSQTVPAAASQQQTAAVDASARANQAVVEAERQLQCATQLAYMAALRYNAVAQQAHVAASAWPQQTAPALTEAAWLSQAAALCAHAAASTSPQLTGRAVNVIIRLLQAANQAARVSASTSPQAASLAASVAGLLSLEASQATRVAASPQQAATQAARAAASPAPPSTSQNPCAAASAQPAGQTSPSARAQHSGEAKLRGPIKARQGVQSKSVLGMEAGAATAGAPNRPAKRSAESTAGLPEKAPKRPAESTGGDAKRGAHGEDSPCKLYQAAE